MKVWMMHVIAGVVGFCLAALIVFLVFGNASQQGAAQDGSAPNARASAQSLCGSVSPSDTATKEARFKASQNLPQIIDPTGRSVTISRDRPDQLAWFANLHAASGMCIDEVRIGDTGITIAMSTVDGVSDADAAAYAGATIAAANESPLYRPRVKLTALVDGNERTASVSRRAWTAFLARGEQLGHGTSMADLIRFRRNSSFSQGDLHLVGWS